MHTFESTPAQKIRFLITPQEYEDLPEMCRGKTTDGRRTACLSGESGVGMQVVEGETLMFHFSYTSTDRETLKQRYSPEPTEISFEQFMNWLECLPPRQWVNRHGYESFKVGELAYDNTTTICVRDAHSNRCWTFHGHKRLPHPSIVGKVLQYRQEHGEQIDNVA